MGDRERRKQEDEEEEKGGGGHSIEVQLTKRLPDSARRKCSTEKFLLWRPVCQLCC